MLTRSTVFVHSTYHLWWGYVDAEILSYSIFVALSLADTLSEHTRYISRPLGPAKTSVVSLLALLTDLVDVSEAYCLLSL